MTTVYYITYKVRKSNGVRCWYNTGEYKNMEEARERYESEMRRSNVVEMEMIQKDHYEASELVPELAKRQPWGADSFRTLRRYDRI